MSCSIQRVALHEKLPLSQPFSLHIYPSFYCNFKCGYCLHSLDPDVLRRKGFRRQFMDFDIYRKAVDDAAAQGWKLKAMIFAGHGEPLLHRQIAHMIAYAKEKDVTERTEIVTNGSLLTHELSDALIAAGLDRLRISLQGVSSGAYKETAGVAVDFEQFVENIRYFYHRKTSTDVYIKIIDLALSEPGDREKFERIFQPVADTVAVEYAIPFVPEIQIERLSGRNKQGCAVHASTCSMPFYMLVLYPNGDVLPCCSTEVPKVFGNITKKSLKDIWESRIRTEFLLRQLDGVQSMPVCCKCAVPSLGLQEGDSLEGHQRQLKTIYKTILEADKGANYELLDRNANSDRNF